MLTDQPDGPVPEGWEEVLSGGSTSQDSLSTREFLFKTTLLKGNYTVTVVVERTR